MIELVGFDSCELGFEFIKDEVISFRTISVTEDKRMTQVDGIWV